MDNILNGDLHSTKHNNAFGEFKKEKEKWSNKMGLLPKIKK